MKRHISLFLLLFVWLLINGCSTQMAHSNSEGTQVSLPLLLFQKTPCFGTCPAYDALISENGNIEFVEYKNALAQDTIQIQLTVEELQQLKEKIEELNFKALQNSYPSQWSDNSSTYLTFYVAGKEGKRVKHEEGGPQQLVLFQEWLHTLIWQRAEDKKRPTY